MFNHAQFGKIMSLLLPALAMAVSAPSMADAGAEVTKVKKSEAVCFDDYPSPGYRVCWYGITIDSSRLGDSEEILNVKYLNTIEVYDADGRLIDKETQVTVTNENAEMEVYETLVQVSPQGEVETCKTILKDSAGEDLFIHNLGDCPETSAGVQSSATIVLQSDRQGLLAFDKGCASALSAQPEATSSDNLMESSLDGSELVSSEASGQASSVQIQNTPSGAEVYHVEKSNAICYPAGDDIVFCDYYVQVDNEGVTTPGEVTKNYKLIGKREVYLNGSWNTESGEYQTGAEYNYDGNFVEKYNMAQRLNESENSSTLWEANVNAENDTVTYCRYRVKAVDGELIYEKDRCDSIVLNEVESALLHACISEPECSEGILQDILDAHKSTLLRQSDPELLQEQVTTLLKAYDSGLSEEIDLDTLESLVAALLEEYETALAEQSDPSLVSQIEVVAGGDDAVQGPELEGSAGQEGAEVIIEKKTDTVCFDENGNIVDDVKNSAGYVNCYYSKEHIVYLPTSSSVGNNNQWTGKIEVYRDGKLVQKYDEAWKNHSGENVAVTWYAYFTINEVTGQLEYCTTRVVVQNDGQLFETTTCEEADGVFLY